MPVKPRPVVKVNKRTRQVEGVYDCCGRAAEANQLNQSGIRHSTHGLSAGEHYWRFKDEFDPDEDLTGMPNCPVVARDLKTGQTAWFCDVRTASEKLGVSTDCVYQSIRHGRKVRNRLVFAFYGKRIA